MPRKQAGRKDTCTSPYCRYDAFRHSKKTEQCSVHFEKAAVLFNLASVLTQQALNADRTTDAGRKEAARKFQVRRLIGSANAQAVA